MAHADINSRVYGFLVEKASNKQTTTYEEIAIAFDLPTTGNALGATLSPILEDIFVFCESHHLPPLTSIVVRKSGVDQGIPGRGFWTLIRNIVLPHESEFTRAEKEVLLKQYHNNVFVMYSGLKK